jgi:hypothetical protein
MLQHTYYWLQARNNVEKWCRQCDICAATHCSQTRNRRQMHQYNVGVPFERIAIDVVGPFPWSDQGNQYLLSAMDCFTDQIFCICQTLEKKWDYNETVHQLFIDFKKAYNSVRREVLYNIPIEFGVTMKLFRQLKRV